MYALLRAIAGIALRWFYRSIDVEGMERIPGRGPVLLAVNHPNALVDALVIAWMMPRRVTFTAKATLFSNPLLARFLAWQGVVPLVRTRDLESVAGPRDASRNERAFRALDTVLLRGGAILIFPEGTTHDEPALAPLRTGTARIALRARDDANVRGLAIVPVGLTFERKDAPRTRVLAKVGDPLFIDEWRPPRASDPVNALTEEVDQRLRAVTLNFPTADDAARASKLAALLAAIFAEPAGIGESPALGAEVALVRRIERARTLLAADGDPALRARVDVLLRGLGQFSDTLAKEGIALEDVAIATGLRVGARFVVRESAIIALAGPVSLWGTVNHWIPIHAARAIAMRHVEGGTDPAMRTIVAGAALVLAFYAAQGALVAALAGLLPAVLYLLSLPLAADVNFAFRERLAHALRRARTYLLYRRRPALRESLRSELLSLRDEAIEIDEEIRRATVPADAS